MLDIQPVHLKTELITLVPLKDDDFDSVCLAASDPLIWEQHPDRLRYRKDIFQSYFDSAIKSKGAFKVCDTKTGEVIGCSRYYNVDAENKCVMVGYTFLVTKCWGGIYNAVLKKLMLNHAFENGYKVQLQIGSSNIRSQKATEKLGAKKIKEESLDFPNQGPSLHYVYEITMESFRL